MSKEIDQRAQRHDPASKHTYDSNDELQQDVSPHNVNSARESQDVEFNPDAPGGAEGTDNAKTGTREVRPAGKEHLDNPPDKWTKEDEESDE